MSEEPVEAMRNRMLFDWVGFTIHCWGEGGGVPEWQDVAARLAPGLEVEGWMDSPAFQGYAKCRRLGHIAVLFDGPVDMGVHVEVSGKGCRELEQVPGFVGWQEFFGSWVRAGRCHWSRVDVAIDDFCGLLDLVALRDRMEAGGDNVVTRWKGWGCLAKGFVHQVGYEKGVTIEWGSRVSSTYSRMYDKRAQSPGEARMLGAPLWVRWEIEFHNEAAFGLVLAVMAKGMVACRSVFVGLWSVREGSQTRVERRPLAVWYRRLVFDCDEVVRVSGSRRRNETLAASERWIEAQVARSLGFVVASRLSEGDFDYLERLAKQGMSDLLPWQKAIVDDVFRERVYPGHEDVPVR